MLLMTVFAMVAEAAGPSSCPALDRKPGPLEGKPGARKVALVVGVGDYGAKIEGRSIDIPAASTDARDIGELLIGTFGFPRRNVCVLRDREATHAHFFEAYDASFTKVAK
ncbi:MAG: hypothetical protein AAF211_32210, partial [Myxococcota bacterium]